MALTSVVEGRILNSGMGIPERDIVTGFRLGDVAQFGRLAENFTPFLQLASLNEHLAEHVERLVVVRIELNRAYRLSGR